MPVVGNNYNFTPYSLAQETEVKAAIAMAVAKTVEILVCGLMGDPNPGADPQEYSAKRCFFRHAELMAIPKDPASMTVQLSEGAGWMNDGDAHAGTWFHVFAPFGAKQKTLSASHPTLDRFDILYAVTKLVGTSEVSRQVVDNQGNISNVNDFSRHLDDFDLFVEEGAAGAGFPQTGGVDLNRANAWQHLPAGQIPIAVIKVRAGTTVIENDDITDLRELLIWRTYPINYDTIHPDVKEKLGILWPLHMGMPFVLLDADKADNVPHGAFFIDATAGGPGTLKFRKLGGDVVTIDVS